AGRGLDLGVIITLRGQQQRQCPAAGIAYQLEIAITLTRLDPVQGLPEAADNLFGKSLTGPQLRTAACCLYILARPCEVDAGGGVFKCQLCAEPIARRGAQARARTGGPGMAIAFDIDTDSGTGNGLLRSAHCQWEGVAGDDLQLVMMLCCELSQQIMGALAADKHGADQQRHDLSQADSPPTRAVAFTTHLLVIRSRNAAWL